MIKPYNRLSYKQKGLNKMLNSKIKRQIYVTVFNALHANKNLTVGYAIIFSLDLYGIDDDVTRDNLRQQILAKLVKVM